MWKSIKRWFGRSDNDSAETGDNLRTGEEEASRGNQMRLQELTAESALGGREENGNSDEKFSLSQMFSNFKKNYNAAVDEKYENSESYKKRGKWDRFKWAIQNPLAFTFGGLRKGYRKAVDERNEYYDDYKKQDKWTRFKWAIKNPLAFTFGRMESSQKNTKERVKRKKELENLNFDTLESITGIQEGQTGSIKERARALEAMLPKKVLGDTPERRAGKLAIEEATLGERSQQEKDAEKRKDIANASLGTTIGGTVLTTGATVLDMMRDWNNIKDEGGALKDGMGKTVDGLGDTLKWDGLKKFNKSIGTKFGGLDKEVLNKVSGSLDITGGALGIASGGLALSNTIDSTKRLWNGGDKKAAVARGFDAVSDSIGMLKGVNSIAKGSGTLLGEAASMAAPITIIGGGLNAIGGAAKTVSGSIEVDRAKDVKKSTEAAKQLYEGKKENLKRQLENSQLSTEERKRLENYKKQLEMQIGFMRMGHNTARVDHTRAGFKTVDGVLNTVGGLVTAIGTPLGFGAAGTVLGLVGTAAGIGGNLYADSKAKEFKKGEVDETLDMNAQIQSLVARSKDKGINLTEREAKHMILRNAGYLSRSDAYLKLAKQRKESMDNLPEVEKNAMLSSLGLDPENAEESIIYQRLGLDELQAQNVDRHILETKKKKTLPSWRQ